MAFGRSRDTGERSAEERARAAAERAARRAQPPPPAETFQDTAPPEPEEPAVGWQDRREEPYDLTWDEPAREPSPAVTAVEDRPPAPRRVPSSRRPIRRRPAPRPRSGGSWGRRILAVVALLAIGFALYLINATFQPFHGDGSGEPVQVSIPENTDAGTIGDLLAAKGVVANGGFFELNATLTGRRGSLRPGEYTLTGDMSYGDAIAALEKGPKVKVVPTVNVTRAGGPLDPRGGAGGRQAAAEGQLPARRRTSRASCAGSAGSAPRAARARPRASCSRPPTRWSTAARRATW